MNRRKAIGLMATGAGMALAGPAVLVQTGCGSTKQLVKWTSTGIAVLNDVSPILADMGAGQVVNLISQALPVAEKLKGAFSANDNASAGKLLASLIEPQSGLISQIADAVGLLANDARKKIVMGSLAIAQVSFRLISAQIETDIPATTATDLSKSIPRTAKTIRSAAAGDKLQLAFEASRF